MQEQEVQAQEVEETADAVSALQDKLASAFERQNVMGTRIVESSDAPILSADWFAQHRDTAYKTVEVLLQKPDLSYEKQQVYVRRGKTLADQIAIEQALEAMLPKPKDVRTILERGEDNYTTKEAEWVSDRDDLFRRMTLVRFLYQVPDKKRRKSQPPVPLFAWEPGDVGFDVHAVGKITVQELYRAYLRVNPETIPSAELDRFQGVQSDGEGSGVDSSDVSGDATDG